MFRKAAVFVLATASGSAFAAGPLANAVHGLVGVVTGTLNATAGGSSALGSAAPAKMALPSASGLPKLKTSSAALPGLPTASKAQATSPKAAVLPLPGGINVGALEGSGRSAHPYVVAIGGQPVVTSSHDSKERAANGGALDTYDVQQALEPLANALGGGAGTGANSPEQPLATQYLLGLGAGDQGPVNAALFGANGTGNGLSGVGVAVGSGSNTGNGKYLGVGIANDHVTGNAPSGIGIAALSDNQANGSGNTGVKGAPLGVSLLNRGDALTICGAGTCGGVSTLRGSPLNNMIATPSNPLINLVALSDSNDPKSASNTDGALINAAVLAGNNQANNGVINAAVLSGDNVARNSGLLGAAVLSGDRAAAGPIAAGVLNGNQSAQTSKGLPGQGILAAAVLSGSNSARGQSNTDASGAPVIGAEVLGAANSLTGGNGNTSGGGTGSSGGNNGDPTIPVIVIGGGGGGAAGGGGGGGGDPGDGGGNPGGGGGGNNGGGSDDGNSIGSGVCVVNVKNSKGQTSQAVKVHCVPTKQPKAAQPQT